MLVDSVSPSVGSPRLPLVRVRPGSVVMVQLLSTEWLHLTTHWADRSWLCAGEPECRLCQVTPARHLWYLPVMICEAKRVGVVELSNHASSALEQVCRFSGGGFWAGSILDLSRKSKKSPVRTDWVERGELAQEIPACDWITPVMAIFGMPAFEQGETMADYSARAQLKARNLAARAAAAFEPKQRR